MSETRIADPTAARLASTDVTVAIGTELDGVRLLDLDDAGVEALRLLVAARGVVFAREQPMTWAEQVAFGRRLGELHVHPASPGPDGFPEILPVLAGPESTFVEGTGWHTDVSCDAEPPALSLLRIEQCPPVGGDTLWASMYHAYEALPDDLRAIVDTHRALHSGDGYRGRYRDDDAEVSYPSAEHPMVRTHPVTKRRALFVNRGFTRSIIGLDRAESDAVLKRLFDHVAYGAKFQVRWRWTPESVAIWDNRCTQHLAVWDYFPQVRRGWRVTTKGDAPVLV